MSYQDPYKETDITWDALTLDLLSLGRSCDSCHLLIYND